MLIVQVRSLCVYGISVGILLHNFLGTKSNTRKSIDYVLESILPTIPKDYYIDLTANLIPVMMVSKELGQAEARRRARDFFQGIRG